MVTNREFSIETKGGVVSSTVGEKGLSVSVGMGKVRFTHDRTGEPELTPEKINIKGREFTYYLANVGNPHCVIILDDINDSITKEYGCIIEKDARFINRTNIQFVKVIDRSSIQIEIWERGAGYTLASGSSSTAAASVVYSLGLCDSSVNVHMPGGVINIEIDESFFVTMTGPVCKICEGSFAPEALNSL